MLFESKNGEGVQAGRFTAEADSLIHLVANATDVQIRGILGRILHAAQIPANRVARILGVSRTSYFKYQTVPLPEGVADPGEAGEDE